MIIVFFLFSPNFKSKPYIYWNMCQYINPFFVRYALRIAITIKKTRMTIRFHASLRNLEFEHNNVCFHSKNIICCLYPQIWILIIKILNNFFFISFNRYWNYFVTSVVSIYRRYLFRIEQWKCGNVFEELSII
jgi:hypothetical protein